MKLVILRSSLSVGTAVEMLLVFCTLADLRELVLPSLVRALKGRLGLMRAPRDAICAEPAFQRTAHPACL